MVKELVWHGHHEAVFPIEVLAGSFESRLKTIMIVKAKEETPEQNKRRLQLFKKVQNPTVSIMKATALYDKVSAEVDKASAEYGKASAEYGKAWDEYRKASVEADKIIQQNLTEIMELHKTECGCGWTPENRDIFSYQD